MKTVDYETLASLPLFMGIDGATLSSFCETVSSTIQSVCPGTPVALKGSECRMLNIVIEGELTAVYPDTRGIYVLEEFLQGCVIVEPQRLFGLHTTYARTYIARKECRLLRLPKNLLVAQLLDNEVFRLNFMNMVCSYSQQLEGRPGFTLCGSVERRLAAFVQPRLLRPVGHKILHAKMTDLAEQLSTSRLTLSKTLRNLAGKGLIEVRRRNIVIPSFERFAAEVK